MMSISIFIYIGAMLIAAVSQILLKKSANRSYPTRLKEYLNAYVMSAYGLFTISMFTALYAYKYVPVSLAPILESTAIIFITFMGRIFLGEKIMPKKLAGIIVMMAGIAVISLSSFL